MYDGAIPVGDNGIEGYARLLLESPLIAKFDDRITPRSEATPEKDKVTVVPNPYRSRAAWDRSATFGDPLPRHVDFMHLPKAVASAGAWARRFASPSDDSGRFTAWPRRLKLPLEH